MMGKDVMISVFGRVGVQLFAALSTIFVSQQLGPKGVGIFTLFRVIPHLAAYVISLGFPNSTTYLIARSRDKQKVVHSVIAYSLFAGGIFFIGWILITPFLRISSLNELSNYEIYILGIISVCTLFKINLTSIFQGLQQFKKTSFIHSMEDILFIFIFFLFCFIENGNSIVGGMVKSIALASVLTFLITIWSVARLGFQCIPIVHWEILKESILYGLKSFAGGTLNLLNYRLDFLILQTLTTVETVGYYAVASKLAELLRIIPNSVAYVVFPKVAAGDNMDIRRTAFPLYIKTFVVGSLLAIILFMLSPFLVYFFFGENFSYAISPTRILIAGTALMGANGVISGFNAGIGKPEYNTYAVGVSLVVTVVLDFLLIPRFEIIGASIASAIAYATTAIMLIILFAQDNKRAKQLASTLTRLPQASVSAPSTSTLKE